MRTWKRWRWETDLETFLFVMTPWLAVEVGIGASDCFALRCWWGIQVWWEWDWSGDEGQIPWKHEHRVVFWELNKYDQMTKKWQEGHRPRELWHEV